MLLRATSSFEFFSETPVTNIFMLRSQSGPGQFIRQEAFSTSPQVPVSEYLDVYGNICQRLIVPAGKFTMESSVTAECSDTIAMNAGYTPVELHPDHVLQFLLPSRYCESDKVTALASR